MFLALRDIVYARGRFVLISLVVGLITVLLVMLTGLTGGLAKQNTSALETIDPDRYVFTSEEPSFTESQVTDDDVAAFSQYADVVPVGMSQSRLEADRAVGAAVMSLPAGTAIPNTNFVDTAGSADHSNAAQAVIPSQGLIVSSSLLEDAGFVVGNTVEIGGIEAPVVGAVADEYYSHQPVVWASTNTWQEISRAGDDVVGTVLAAQAELSDEKWQAAAEDTGTTVTDVSGSFEGLAAYNSEQGSLLMIQGLLYVISALVTVAFLTVWTIQRTRDLSILRALGASPRYLLKDSLGQAAIVVAVGAVVGGAVGWGLGVLAANFVPFQLDWSTIVLPTVGIWVLGMLGALLATRKVTKVDPLLALGGNA